MRKKIFREKRLETKFVLFLILWLIACQIFPQITLNVQNKPLSEVLDVIERGSNYRFFYNESLQGLEKKITIQLTNTDIDNVMRQILANTEIEYRKDNDNIIVLIRNGNENMQNTTSAQRVQTSIKGQIVDEEGEPVIGASIIEIGNSSNGTISDINGNFFLENISRDAELKISYVGMRTKILHVNGRSPLHIIMESDTELLSEIIVIGYGTAKRKDFTGSVNSVRVENSPIALITNTNALETLKGNIPGLDIGYVNSAGGSPSMQIRGQNSISGSNEPLIVVDGIIFMGKINDINPNDIASYDVLKDATSAAAYGSRSANGVIMITTKKGEIGKPIIHFNANESIQTWHLKPELMNGKQWLEAVAAANGYSDFSFLTSQEELNYNAGKEINWLDEISRTGWIQNYQAAVSGAGERMNYYLSASYMENKGVIKGDDFNRISIFGKINTDITDWLQIGLDAAYTKQDYSGVSASIWSASILSPYGMMYRPNGLLEATPDGTRGHSNPLWGIYDESKIENVDYRNNLRTNAYVLVKLPWINGLSYRLNYAGNLDYRMSGSFTHESNFVPNGSYDEDSRYSVATQNSYLSSAGGSIENEKTSSYVIDHILNFNQIFGNHTIDLTAVATRDFKKYEYQNLSGSDFAENGNTTLGINGLHYASTQKITLDNWELTNVGYFGRLSYSFDDKYYLSASIRRDGSSVFGVDNKWGNFGAIGTAWRITNESLIKQPKFLNDLKLKLSWGKNGNQGLSQYSTLSKVSNGQSGGIYYTFNNSGKPSYGINQSSIGNSTLGWETTEAWNTGFESVWLNNRLFINVDIYFSKTYDQIFLRTIPVMTGFRSMYSSMGEVNNRGIEMIVKNINIQNEKWNWNTELTFWLNRNRLIHLYGEDLDGDGIEDDDIGNGLFIGESIHSIYGYKQDGIVQSDDIEYMNANGVSPGVPKYVDMNSDGIIDAEDRSILGYTAPNFKLNISNTLQYKSWELYVMIAGVFGGNNYFLQSNQNAYITSGNRSQFASNGLYVPFWTESNPNNKYPAATFVGDSYFLGLQSRAYIRLQDITLSYTFNQPWVKNAGIQNFKLFCSGRNLATITDWQGGDPETGSTALSGTYPITSSISLGLNLSF